MTDDVLETELGPAGGESLRAARDLSELLGRQGPPAAVAGSAQQDIHRAEEAARLVLRAAARLRERPGGRPSSAGPGAADGDGSGADADAPGGDPSPADALAGLVPPAERTWPCPSPGSGPQRPSGGEETWGGAASSAAPPTRFACPACRACPLGSPREGMPAGDDAQPAGADASLWAEGPPPRAEALRPQVTIIQGDKVEAANYYGRVLDHPNASAVRGQAIEEIL